VDSGAISRETVKAEEFEKKLRAELYAYLPRTRVSAGGISVVLNPETRAAEVTFPGTWNSEDIRAVQRAIQEKSLSPTGYRVRYP